MKGFGTVVTGTLVAGTIQREQELEVFPISRSVRVRGVQVHGDVSDSAFAGQRTALNVAGAGTDDLSRGMSLAPAGTFAATRSVDVRLRLLPTAARPLKDKSRVHFHAYTTEALARVELYQTKEVKPSEAVFAQLSFPDSMLLVPGDRFILRQFSPVITIGGGVVLDTAPILSPKEVRRMERIAGSSIPAFYQSMACLERFQEKAAILSLRVTRRGRRGLSFPQAVAETGWPQPEIAQLAGVLSQENRVVQFEGRMFAPSESELSQRSLLDAVSDFHKHEPLKAGIPREELRDKTGGALQMAQELYDATLATLVQRKKIEIAGDLVRLAGRGIEMKDEEVESKQKIEATFAESGLKVPALQEVIASLKVDKTRAQRIVTLLLREKTLVKISDDLVFHRAALDELRSLVKSQKAKSPKMDITKFKELTGVSRKYAIPLLEYLDREHVTRRIGDAREIL